MDRADIAFEKRREPQGLHIAVDVLYLRHGGFYGTGIYCVWRAAVFYKGADIYAPDFLRRIFNRIFIGKEYRKMPVEL